jgi:hypothetical protein
MKAITPVHLGDKGADVSNLHKALLFLIVHESIEPSDIRIIREQLAPEVAGEKFGSATEELVRIYQHQLNTRTGLDIPKGLTPLVENGDVDQKTAKALNWDLRHLGGLRAAPKR